MQLVAAMNKPSWWNENHEGTWDRIKGALKRDWEQTKADVSSKGHDLDQSAGDTVKQAAGKQPIPPGNAPNASPNASKNETWDDVEPRYRYGVGAQTQHGGEGWNDRVESKMREEWTQLKNGQTWDEVKSAVRRAWDNVKK